MSGLLRRRQAAAKLATRAITNRAADAIERKQRAAQAQRRTELCAAIKQRLRDEGRLVE